jgi:hypothetical protein
MLLNINLFCKLVRFSGYSTFIDRS